MLKVVWISDLHFAANGPVAAHDPRARTASAIEFVNRHHGDADLCVISGDLVNYGTREDYAALRSRLDALEIPYHPMVGNADDRDLLRSSFDLPETCMDEFVQYSVPTPEGRIICLDTQKAGADEGEFCEARRQWLVEALERNPHEAVFLFMHHPPMKLGLPMQDTVNLLDGDGFLDLIAAYRQIRYLFMGHVHRPISGTVRGIAFSTMRSTLYQAPAPRPDWDWDSFAPAREAPNLGTIEIANGDACLHFLQFCDYGTGTD